MSEAIQTTGSIMSGIGQAAEDFGGKFGGVAGGIVAGIGALLDMGGIIMRAADGGPVKLVEMRDEAKDFAESDRLFDAWFLKRTGKPLRTQVKASGKADGK